MSKRTPQLPGQPDLSTLGLPGHFSFIGGGLGLEGSGRQYWSWGLEAKAAVTSQPHQAIPWAVTLATPATFFFLNIFSFFGCATQQVGILVP